MKIEMSDYPILLAKLRQYFPKLIVQSYEPSNANSDVGKVTLEVSSDNTLAELEFYFIDNVMLLKSEY